MNLLELKLELLRLTADLQTIFIFSQSTNQFIYNERVGTESLKTSSIFQVTYPTRLSSLPDLAANRSYEVIV